MIGYDYGLKPRIIISGNMEFPELLSKAFVALMYGHMPQFGVLVNPPFLGMAFDDESTARKCFSLFKSWSNASDDGDAVAISFIEFDNGENGMCIYPHMDRLLYRIVPEAHRDEFEPITFVVGHLKMFPRRSDGYLYFRSAVEKSPFVVFPETYGGPIMDLAFRKREVQFYKEDEVPSDSLEASLLRASRDELNSVEPRPLPPGDTMDYGQVASRRRKQLSRFYPVTLERLRFSPDFAAVRRTLEGQGYREWQIIQAACNLALRQQAPELFQPQGDEDQPSQSDILDYLLSTPDNVMTPTVDPTTFNIQDIREQIKLDTMALLHYFVLENSEVADALQDEKVDLQVELAKHDLLEG